MPLQVQHNEQTDSSVLVSSHKQALAGDLSIEGLNSQAEYSLDNQRTW